MSVAGWLSIAVGGAACLAPAPTDCWIATRAEYRMRVQDGRDPAPEALSDAARTIGRRLERHGLADFAVAPQTPDRIVVSLPAGADSPEVRDLIHRGGRLEIVPIPADAGPVERGDPLSGDFPPLLGPGHFEAAHPSSAADGVEALELRLTPGGAALLERHTEAHVGSQVAVVLDGEIVSAPIIQAPIADGGLVIVPFDAQEAETLGRLLLDGPLAHDLEEIRVEAPARPAGCP